MRLGRGGEAFDVVAAFQHGDEATVAMLVGELHQAFGKRLEVRVEQPEVPEGIAEP